MNKSHIKFDIFEDYPIVAAFSTRNGGVSEAPFNSMNLAFNKGDKLENVLENYKIFANDISVDYNNIVISYQKHNDNILIASNEHAGMGLIKERAYSDIDGIYTEKKGLAITTVHADCTPIFFYDKKRNAIGLVHSGWRGTAKRITKKMLDLFLEKGSNLNDIICAIGPAICLGCYEVGNDVLEACLPDESLLSSQTKTRVLYKINPKTQKPHVNLKAINSEILIQAGLPQENIEVSELCTKCRNDLFFSHRLLGNKRGTQIACMCLLN